MGYTQAIEMANLMDLEQGIRWQLLYNHYPPVPSEMIPGAIQAIEAYREGDYHRFIKSPFKHIDYWYDVPAHVIVDIFHLEPWCD